MPNKRQSTDRIAVLVLWMERTKSKGNILYIEWADNIEDWLKVIGNETEPNGTR